MVAGAGVEGGWYGTVGIGTFGADCESVMEQDSKVKSLFAARKRVLAINKLA